MERRSSHDSDGVDSDDNGDNNGDESRNEQPNADGLALTGSENEEPTNSEEKKQEEEGIDATQVPVVSFANNTKN